MARAEVVLVLLCYRYKSTARQRQPDTDNNDWRNLFIGILHVQLKCLPITYIPFMVGGRCSRTRRSTTHKTRRDSTHAQTQLIPQCQRAPAPIPRCTEQVKGWRKKEKEMAWLDRDTLAGRGRKGERLKKET